jgi:formate-dependent phosphoribosylglycinamide formyltransferase (GAR transformylase)
MGVALAKAENTDLAREKATHAASQIVISE